MKKIENKRRQVTFYIDSAYYDLFCKKYPNVTAPFMRRCVVEAIRNKDFFQHMFFEVNENLNLEDKLNV